ncbi:GNAT family N-acetyltransferase [Streptomyces flavochromogenes]|uniref:GNAT family N-acetyltransferase n=1 Tax=Streptomyces flavochromogenes TaxID=68199 RepID=A0ABW6XYT8_9ACTN|nr:GNAT family N-acetyltransferase [Streptomyces flavochromogenes]
MAADMSDDTADDLLLVRARGLWEELAEAPVSFASTDGPAGHTGPAVVVSPNSALCPPSWAGIVVLGDAAIATAPTESAALVLRRALASVPVDSLTRPEAVRAVLPVSDVLGPASLAYLSSADFRPAHRDGVVEPLASGHPDFQGLLRAAGPEDVAESGMEEITSPAFVVREGTDVVAAAGYRAWPAATAHICVLTHPQWRGRRLARHASSAAVAHALAAGLLPQWRARPPASRRVARSLGFRELGGQLSVRWEAEALAPVSTHPVGR